MKPTLITRVISINLIVLAVAVLLAGCFTNRYNTYSGPTLPKGQVGIIKPYFSLSQGFILRFMGCDGVECKADYDELALLPGKHTIKFTAMVFTGNSFQGIGDCDKEINVEAGGRYLATGTLAGSLSVDIVRQK